MDIIEFVSEKLKECKTADDYKSIIAFLLSEHVDLQNIYTETMNVITDMYGEADASLILDVVNSKAEHEDNKFPVGKDGEELAIISKVLAEKLMENDLPIYEVFPDSPSVLLNNKTELDNANIVAIDSKLAVLTGELLYKYMNMEKDIDITDTKE